MGAAEYRFVEGRAEKLPYDSASFDMLFSRRVVTTIAIPQALAEFNSGFPTKRWRRLLAASGISSNVTFQADSLNATNISASVPWATTSARA